jgi:glyoxalase family protein
MVHRVAWRVGSEDSLDFWAERLRGEGIESERTGSSLRFDDPEGLGLELRAVAVPDGPLVGRAPDIPVEHALQGFDGVRAYSPDPERSRRLLEGAMGFEARDDGWEVRGEHRGSLYAYDPPPAEPGIPGAGTVHHVAWASTTADHEAWRERLQAEGVHPTPVIDRFYFRSIYFREPSGVLFEIATIGPGFAVDEDADHLGESLSLPPAFEHLRDRLDGVLTPLPDVRRLRVGSESH